MRELGVGLGNPVPRTEDARLLTGQGSYTDDIFALNAAVMHVVRSPHACARIVSIDKSAALTMPGVLAVLTGDDARAENFAPFNSRVQRQRPNGEPNFVPPYGPLAIDYAPHAGVAIAAVIAESGLQAKDAAERLQIEYEVLPSVVDTARALDESVPIVWPELADNCCFEMRLGNRTAAAAAFAQAATIVRERFVVSRMAANAMENRAALGRYDPAERRFTLYSGLQSPHAFRQEIASVFRLPANQFRVVSPDVGGAFGMKGSLYQEQVLVLWAARKLCRPVKWMAERSEAFLSDHQARDNISDVELALDERGHFLALRVNTVANLGAYVALNGLHAPTNNIGGLAGVYKIPNFDVCVTGVFTHTVPTCPFRGAGRPEASYCIERIIDKAARVLKISPPELRRRNMIASAEMPYNTGLVYTYDCGDFEGVMDRCLREADWAGFDARRTDTERRGKLRGIGIASVIEIAGGPQNTPFEEAVEIRFDATGSATLLVGSHSQGQGHETVYRQMAAEFLGLPPEQLRVVAGDTDQVYHGRGTFGSRTMMAAGTSFVVATQRVIDRGKEIAGHLLEVGANDIEFKNGTFSVTGTDRGITIQDVARAAFNRVRLPAGMELGLEGKATIAPQGASFPNGCHICEVEVDPDTGTMKIVRYTVVDDVGRVMNPLLLKGQIHGGVVQGIGQALMEEIVYESGDGQLVSGSFMDYGMPRAEDVPMIGVHSHDVPTSTNPLGVKGAGEAGTVGALPAVMNAVADALYVAGVETFDMPASPYAVWQALHKARQEN